MLGYRILIVRKMRLSFKQRQFALKARNQIVAGQVDTQMRPLTLSKVINFMALLMFDAV